MHESPRSPCILVVEDDKLTREIVVAFLRRGGYTNIVEAGLAEQAMFHIFKDRDLHIHLALVDLMLPNANGLTLIRKIRESKKAAKKNLPVIVMTGRTDTDTYKMAARRGVQGYLLKPLSAALLNETVGKVLTARGIKPPVPAEPLSTLAGPPANQELPPSLDEAF
ncbi:MAG: response regulator [Rhodospirillaceae bacterium]|nr:MAG: response regulator [Rhodospirillaceae bacterium]